MKKNNSGKGSMFPVIVGLVILIVIVIFAVMLLSKKEKNTMNKLNAAFESSKTSELESTVSEQPTEEAKKLPENLGLRSDDIYSSSALLTDMEGNTLFSVNADSKQYPASLTKMMTAIVAIENIDDLSKMTTIPSSIFAYTTEQDASVAGFSPNENVCYIDLLYGTLLSSGAECCLTLAYDVAGTEEGFVEMMNAKADELGMTGTHFTNVCGLHDDSHYSTASDMNKLLAYSLKNSQFKKIFTTPKRRALSSMHSDGLDLVSTMFSAMSSPDFRGGKILGGKTGYTDEAGLCLASLSQIDGEEYILITMGATGSHVTEPYHIYDAVKVYETLANGGPLPEEPTKKKDVQDNTRNAAADFDNGSAAQEYYVSEESNDYSESYYTEEEQSYSEEPVYTDPPEEEYSEEPVEEVPIETVPGAAPDGSDDAPATEDPENPAAG